LKKAITPAHNAKAAQRVQHRAFFQRSDALFGLMAALDKPSVLKATDFFVTCFAVKRPTRPHPMAF
jgi:hypothetical protein